MQFVCCLTAKRFSYYILVEARRYIEYIWSVCKDRNRYLQHGEEIKAGLLNIQHDEIVIGTDMWKLSMHYSVYIYGLVQDCSNSIAD